MRREKEQPWNYAEVAEYFRVTVRTVQRWVKTRRIKATRTRGRTFIPDAEVCRLAGIHESQNESIQKDVHPAHSA